MLRFCRPFWKLAKKQLAVSRIIKSIHARAISMSSPRGTLVIGHLAIPCAFGRSGRSTRKREGDGATPVGSWRFCTLYWRADRRPVPAPALAKRPLEIRFGWCDAAGDRNYNRPVTRPYAASHEELWRQDHLYDVVITLSHNVKPRVQGHGSAVFFHLATDDLRPTAGCVAIRARDAARLLRFLGPATRLVVHP